MLTREDYVQICKTCKNRKLDSNVGLVCQLTGNIADFDTECPNYSQDTAKTHEKLKINIVSDASFKIIPIDKSSAEKGRKKTINFMIIIVVSLFLFSIITLSVSNKFDDRGLMKVFFRFIFLSGLLYAIYLGKNWARVLLTILLVIGIGLGFIMFIMLISKIFLAFLFLAIVGFYGYMIYYFYADKDFLNFYNYQNQSK